MAKQADPGFVFHCFGYGFGSVVLAWFSWVCLWVWLLFHGFAYGCDFFFMALSIGLDCFSFSSVMLSWFCHCFVYGFGMVFHGFACDLSRVLGIHPESRIHSSATYERVHSKL